MKKPGYSWLTPVLCVTNLVQSLEHYEKVLGFEVSWKWSEDEAFDETAKPTFACINRGECSIFLCQNGQGNPGAWICLTLRNREDLEQLCRRPGQLGGYRGGTDRLPVGNAGNAGPGPG